MLTTTKFFNDDDNDDDDADADADADDQSSCACYVLEGWELVLKVTGQFIKIITFRHCVMGQSQKIIT